MNELQQRFIRARRQAIALNYQHLNDKQREAVLSTEGPLLLLAGAGSGKTTVLINRVANLLRYGRGSDTEEIPMPISDDEVEFLEQYVRHPDPEQKPLADYLCAVEPARPWEVLAITFTNKAANELKDRLERMLGEESRDVWAATFHSACVRILRRDIDKLGFDRSFTIYDTDDTKRVLKDILKELELDEKTFPVREIQTIISRSKDDMILPEEFAAQAEKSQDWRRKRIGKVYALYNRKLRDANALDFDDIILHTVDLLRTDRETLAYYQRKFRYVLIDEYQDTNHLQYLLASLLAGGHRNICVVGDPAQTIYSFAGASSYNLLNFASEFGPLTADVRLNNDYRSTPQIVNYVNRVLEASPQRADYLKLNSKRDPGRRVSQTVYNSDLEEARGVAARIRRLVDEGASPGDCAILTRVNAQQKILCRALGEQHLRYRVKRDSGWQNSALADDAQTRLAMLEALGAGGDVKGVTISTIHASKGLEFKHVFLIGCSEGLIPYGSPPEGDLLEEERRLMYVAVTRAEDTLDVSYARAREDDGSDRGRRKSRFFR